MILILNAGSSSLKFKLFTNKDDDLVKVESGSINDIGKVSCKNHTQAVNAIIDKIDEYCDNIGIVGHRIVFGGNDAIDGELINKSVINRIKEYYDIAPLHNHAVVATYLAVVKKLKQSKHYAYYDTNYFKDLSPLESIIPIDQNIANKYHIQRHGFHGISHRYAFENSDCQKYQRVITVHIGAGSSLAAILDGKPIATSMGFTPLGGIPMLTRCGDIDPGVVIYLEKMLGRAKTNIILNNYSGITGIVGKKVNMFDILYMADEKVEDDEYSPGNVNITEGERQKAKFALEYFCYRIKQYIGAYAASMGGLDAIIFTGRAGAGSGVIRNKVCYGLDYLNLKEVMVVPPDEELAIAKMINDNNL